MFKINDENDIMRILDEYMIFKTISLDNDIFKNYMENKKVLIYTLKIDGTQLKFINSKLKHDKDVIKAALNQYPYSIQYVDKKDLDRKKIILPFLKKNPYIINYLGECFTDNETIMFENIRKYPYGLRFASNRLKDNEKLVLKSIEKEKKYIKYASTRLKNLCNENNCVEIIKKLVNSKNDYINVIEKINKIEIRKINKI